MEEDRWYFIQQKETLDRFRANRLIKLKDYWKKEYPIKETMEETHNWMGSQSAFGIEYKVDMKRKQVTLEIGLERIIDIDGVQDEDAVDLTSLIEYLSKAKALGATRLTITTGSCWDGSCEDITIQPIKIEEESTHAYQKRLMEEAVKVDNSLNYKTQQDLAQLKRLKEKYEG